MVPAPVVVETPATEDERTPSHHCELAKSNSTASRFSILSHVSVRAIGTIPIGELRVHGRSDSPSTERDAIKSIVEEMDPALPSPRLVPPCLTHGDVFRLLDFPGEFIVGHDVTTMTTSESLQGFRDIPPGVHFLWVQKPDPSPRCGYWYLTRVPCCVRVKQWDKFNEVLGDAASQYEARDQEANIESVYSSLVPYNLSGTQTPTTASPGITPTTLWCELTDAISTSFLDRVTGKWGVGEWFVDTTDCVKGDSRLPGGITTASEAYRTVVGNELQFLFSQDLQDIRILDRDATGLSTTDTTDRVLALLNSPSDSVPEEDVVAELQFTFITGIHLGNTACLEQWWKLVLKILLRSFRLVLQRPTLCRWLLRTLHTQLRYTDNHVESFQGDDSLLFRTLPRSKTLLREALAEYKRKLNSLLLDLGGAITQDQQAIGHAFENLEAWLWKHRWDLRCCTVTSPFAGGGDGEEEEDDMPVVVDLDENGRELGLVSFHRD